MTRIKDPDADGKVTQQVVNAEKMFTEQSFLEAISELKGESKEGKSKE